MLRKLSILAAAALVMSACSQPEPAPAPSPPPPPPPKSFMVFFDLNSSTLSTQAVDTLKQAAAADRSSGNAPMTATGHADRSGPDAYNMALSLRRANAVKDSLVRDGVSAASVSVVGRGETQPLVPTADGVVEPQNRRVEIVVGQGAASPNDMAYCRELSVRYRRLLGMTQAQGDAAEAMHQCEIGNPAAGIPVLEKYLTDSKIPLPPRT